VERKAGIHYAPKNDYITELQRLACPGCVFSCLIHFVIGIFPLELGIFI
jgi:hypothetical protein